MIIGINRYRLVFVILLIMVGLATVLLIHKYYPDWTQDKNESKPESIGLVGAFLTWDEVKGAFPKNATADVIDVDSQLSFRVQRRGGSNHVDVQPLTAADSAIMKQIYNGRWTWKRRAVVVKLDNGQMIAASMNGMPHGQGAISGNNFDGHFCIHFRNSKTHGSSKVDLAHQMMIWKAAGLLDQQLALLKPQEIVAVFISALDQNDLKIAGKLIDSADNIEPLLRDLENIKDIKADKITKAEDNKFIVEVRIKFKSTNYEVRKIIVVSTVETRSHGKIAAPSVNDLFDGNTRAELESSTTNQAEEDWD